MGQSRIHLFESMTLVIYCLSICPVGLTMNYICVCLLCVTSFPYAEWGLFWFFLTLLYDNHLLLSAIVSLIKIIVLVFTCNPLHKPHMFCLIVHKNSYKLFSYKSSLKFFSYNALKFWFKRKETWHTMKENRDCKDFFFFFRKKTTHKQWVQNFWYSQTVLCFKCKWWKLK